MNAKRLLPVLIAIASLAAGVSRANAVTIVWEATVRVDFVGGSGSVPDYLAAVQEGDTLRWSVFIDPSGPSNIGDVAALYDVIRAWHIDFPVAPLLLVIPEPSSPAASGGITVINDFNADTINVQANVEFDSADPDLLFHAGMHFDDLSQTALDSVDLPLDPPDLTAFPLHSFIMEFQNTATHDFWRAQGEILAIRRVLTVPEPTSVWLMCAGVFAIFGIVPFARRSFPGNVG